DNWVHWLLIAKFANNNLVLKITSISPFFTNYSFYLYIGIELAKLYPPEISVVQ
ncbi:hypothetical protein NEUTE2DRAFT_72128, partial [Neurospora tetrasperma FGSC 2509]